LAPYVVRRCEANDIRAVVIDGASAAASIIDELRQAGIKVTTTSAADMAAACGTLYDGVQEGWLHHLDDPVINAALGVARKRKLEAAWAWNRKGQASDITPIVACTLALWGAQSSKAKKPRRTGGGKVVVLS
jgi:phage terminase large subunit-like protein